jgi:hypothetical protein
MSDSLPEKKLGRPRKPLPSVDSHGTKARWEGAYTDVDVDQDKIDELARLGPAFDGHVEVDYERESPPMAKRVKAWLEGELFPMIPNPASPGIYLLWHKDRVVYVGTSVLGIFSANLSGHVKGPVMRAGVERKVFDRVSFRALPEEFTSAAAGALVRLLKPKYNRRTHRRPLEPGDIKALEALGYSGIL